MNTSINMKLNELFGDKSFYEKNANVEKLDDLLGVVQMSIPEITKDELSQYLISLGKCLEKAQNEDELSEEELNDVHGGVPLIPFLVTCGVIAGAAYAGGVVGKWIGEAIYWATKK